MIILKCLRVISAVQRHFYLNIPATQTQQVRALFSEKFMGISEYESNRLTNPRFQMDVRNLEFQMRSNDIEALVKSIKQWLHQIDKRECESEFLLLQQCLRCITKNADPSTTYNFGPTVMRMLHYFNLPEKALQISHDLQIQDIFNNLSCTLILCDLLFNNGMYKELVQVLQKKYDAHQSKGTKSSRYQNYLLFAACYKLNTAEYLNYAHEVWQNCVKDHQFTQSINFLSMLAIKQGQPELALEILPTDDKYFSSINLRLLALSECGQFEEALQLTQNILSLEQYRNIKILAEVVQRIDKCLYENPTAEGVPKLNSLLIELRQQNRVWLKYIDGILCWPIKETIGNKSRGPDKQMNRLE